MHELARQAKLDQASAYFREHRKQMCQMAAAMRKMFERANRFGTDLCLGDLYVHGMKVIVAAGDEIACFEQREFAWC